MKRLVVCFGGAYTVHRVAGMLRKCALAPNADEATIKEAQAVYVKRESRADSKAALAFREKHGAQRVPIRFLGVALGALAAWLFERRFPSLAARFTVAAAAGLVAGESLVGVAASFAGMAGD